MGPEEEFAARIAREDAEDARRPETAADRRRRDIHTYDGFSGPNATPRSSDADGHDDD